MPLCSRKTATTSWPSGTFRATGYFECFRVRQFLVLHLSRMYSNIFHVRRSPNLNDSTPIDKKTPLRDTTASVSTKNHRRVRLSLLFFLIPISQRLHYLFPDQYTPHRRPATHSCAGLIGSRFFTVLNPDVTTAFMHPNSQRSRSFPQQSRTTPEAPTVPPSVSVVPHPTGNGTPTRKRRQIPPLAGQRMDTSTTPDIACRCTAAEMEMGAGLDLKPFDSP
ncbi:hypothetical protein B0H11DRAFT_1381767 [Mycena galericulata]|nr:hypothetical protein B0H11DRAFT_1381767 [Mycena galericulata]